MIYLYDNNGEYQGCTTTPDDFADLNKTNIAPPEYDEMSEVLFFVNDSWEKRSI